MRTALLFYLLSLAACTTKPAPISDLIIGRWNMGEIVRDKTEDVTAEHNPKGNRFIIFKADRTFESGGDPYGQNSGTWSLDEPTSVLFLDSDAGEDDDSHWIVTIDGARMHWQGTRFEFNSRFAMNYMREME